MRRAGVRVGRADSHDAPPAMRKLALMAHVATSVGWLGAVIVFLVIALVGLVNAGFVAVRGVYLVMERAALLALLPLAGSALLTGLVSALGTPWGLFRHYWVIIKLAITAFATAILVAYMQTFRTMAADASNPAVDLAALRNPSPVVHASLALVLLLVACVLAVYKPRAMTRYGWRNQRASRGAAEP